MSDFTAYVGGISYDAREDDLRRFFERCGPINSVRMPVFPDSGRCKGIAFVEFGDREALDAALRLTDSDFMGRSIRVDLARGKSDDRSDRRGGLGGDRRGGDRFERRDRTPPRGRRGGFENKEPVEPSDSVFVGNLSFQAGERDLEDHFMSCGTIVSVKIPLDRESGRQKGFGYITFDSVDAAKRALEKTGTMIAGREIRVDFALSKDGGSRASGRDDRRRDDFRRDDYSRRDDGRDEYRGGRY